MLEAGKWKSECELLEAAREKQRRTEWRCGRRRSREVPCLAVREERTRFVDRVPGLGWISEWECDDAETSDCINVKGKGRE